MRKYIVAGNWKMNTTVPEGVELAKSVVEKSKELPSNVELVVAPPFTHLASVAEALKGSKVVLSAQNCADHAKGAYTGEISADMLNNRGLDLALFGDEYTAMAGADPLRIRNISMIGSCLMAGAVTAFCGPLGFVGIVAPHIARTLTGSSVHIRTIPASLLVGAGLSLIADILSQAFPTPLPVGSTLAIIGIPIILIILFKR